MKIHVFLLGGVELLKGNRLLESNHLLANFLLNIWTSWRSAWASQTLSLVCFFFCSVCCVWPWRTTSPKPSAVRWRLDVRCELMQVMMTLHLQKGDWKRHGMYRVFFENFNMHIMTSYIIILKLIVMFLPDCSILRKYACCLCILSLHSLLWDAKGRSTSHTALLPSGSHKAEFTGLGSWYQLVWERYPMAILWFAVSVESCFLYNYPNWCNICCSSTVYPFVVWMTGLFIYISAVGVVSFKL